MEEGKVPDEQQVKFLKLIATKTNIKFTKERGDSSLKNGKFFEIDTTPKYELKIEEPFEVY